MNFNAHTKISEIIRHHKDSIDAIASIAPPFRRLKNPILRKLMAPRVSVAEAAKIGGCKVDDFARVLAPLGFRFAGSSSTAAQRAPEKKPEWLISAADADITTFDVRPILESGTDPLKDIMKNFKAVAPGKILCIINSFLPTPLIHLLQKDKAEACFSEQTETGEFFTYFLKKKPTTAAATSDQKTVMHDAVSFEKICSLFGQENIKEIDVRMLEMPGPMQNILAALETLPPGKALFVHHKRVPVYLLEELADKDFAIHIYNIGEGNVKILIFKD